MKNQISKIDWKKEIENLEKKIFENQNDSDSVIILIFTLWYLTLEANHEEIDLTHDVLSNKLRNWYLKTKSQNQKR